MKVREKCCAGALKGTPIKGKKGFEASDSCIPRVTDTYNCYAMVCKMSVMHCKYLTY